ncbi:hypothetical protein LIA77_02670 [Sarocladium implicatum]|nr:hypothetical protein LIA77_02670 [Sarocladium implicatum]
MCEVMELQSQRAHKYEDLKVSGPLHRITSSCYRLHYTWLHTGNPVEHLRLALYIEWAIGAKQCGGSQNVHRSIRLEHSKDVLQVVAKRSHKDRQS